MIGIIRSYLSVVKEYITFKDIQKTYALLIPYMLKYWKAYTALFFLLFFDICQTLAYAWFFGDLTDAAIHSNFTRMKQLIPIGVTLVTLSLTSTYLNTVLETMATNSVKRDFSAHLLKHILLLNGKMMSSHHSGELMSHFSNDIHSIDGVIGRSLIDLLRLPFTYLAVLIYLMQINWHLALLCALVAPIAMLLGVVFGLLLRNNGRLVYSLIGNISALLNETFQGLHVIRSFMMEKSRLAKFVSKNQELYNLELGSAKLRGWFYVGGHAVTSITFLVSLCMGSYYVSLGVMTVGSLLTFVNLVNNLVYPLTELAGQWAGFQRAASAMERIFKILAQPTESLELPSAVQSRPLEKSIRFEDITFSYDGHLNIFDHLYLQFPAGKVIAIVGLSGAGKTTLFNLLLAFYKPQSGKIYMDDCSTEDFSPSELRSLFAHVSQETFLFGSTIRENLLLARMGITEAEMMKAAVIADIHSFIQSLPHGYDTEIGERGVRLSGGQKQRLAIARAVLKNAPILLLDEATSALDNETEHQVKEALHRLMAGRTTIVIAHRLSTVQYADVIIVMDKGKIVQTGCHTDLMKEHGLYRTLNRKGFQKGEEIVDHSFDTSVV
ncbi:ABC transporter ATP-binding protein [Paenibacillus aceris]|uniref:ABC-type multidrug transport system fused ATPase/permease subunit n=1 Tax=Paenibacillus aceris TaxID=869555 RepID=A0ABS4IAE6_9BACL|nr:ABC transporter ATP-binding protein [Paenibacillus aceris]MBP1967044.1 ABC-type multidrug transport system fused ATPase/permease subunit [Paenibacillus aceris]NHW33241.1 ABC transporter ATP-binding protein [Paenibacillus aceris]